jgi:hypothetical protein
MIKINSADCARPFVVLPMTVAPRMFATGARGHAIPAQVQASRLHANVAEHLILVRNTVCGRWVRAGAITLTQ